VIEQGASLTRRNLLRLAAVAGLVVMRGPSAQAASPAPGGPPAAEVLQRLLEGNQRFVKGETSSPRRGPDDFRPLAEGQRPVAVIVGCADSRVPPELLFDQGVGDLFVVRVAGNVVKGAGPPVKGSIEYGVAELGVSLVMVLGHSECGAVKAAIKHIDDRDALPGALGLLVNSIRPAVIKAKGMPGDLLDNALRANVAIGVETLRGLQPIVAPAVKRGQVKVVGAMYDLRTGSVSVTG
jgi:carbonic anhydrase